GRRTIDRRYRGVRLAVGSPALHACPGTGIVRARRGTRRNVRKRALIGCTRTGRARTAVNRRADRCTASPQLVPGHGGYCRCFDGGRRWFLVATRAYVGAGRGRCTVRARPHLRGG